MATYRDNPITPQDPVALAPLTNSYEADEIESELKAIFQLMYANYLRASERDVNSLGFPQQGSDDQFERAVKADGLALLRTADRNIMRYLFRVWKARNPKRGLGVLRAYLQLLWPNGWEMYQEWHDPAATYPAGVSDTYSPGFYLTSRIKVAITSTSSTGSDVIAAASSMRSVLPARFVLAVELLSRPQIGLDMTVGMGHALYHDIVGSFL